MMKSFILDNGHLENEVLSWRKEFAALPSDLNENAIVAPGQCVSIYHKMLIKKDTAGTRRRNGVTGPDAS